MATDERRQSTGGTAGNAFEEAKFMKDLIHLRDTQESIQGLSAWAIRNRKNAYKIARCWLKCTKKVKTEQKLTLFHLVNDIVQHSKRKNYAELLEKFQVVLKESMPHLKDAKICEKVVRCLNIWQERLVFEEKFITDLLAVVDPAKNKTADQDILDTFQPTQLCTQIKIMKALEDDTDYKLKTVKEAEINLIDFEDENSLRQNLKDRQHGNDYINDVEESKKRLEQYIKAIDREVTKRRQVIDMLTHGGKYYDSLRGEAHIVAQAYTNFGKRVNNLNKKLKERVTELEKNPGGIATLKKTSSAASGGGSFGGGGGGVMIGPTGSPLDNNSSSPIPSPDYDAPSPVADEMELELPDEESPNRSSAGGGGAMDSLTSRLDSMRDSLSKGKSIQESGAAASRRNLDTSRDSSHNSTYEQLYGQPATPTPTSNASNQQQPPDMSISEYLTKLASESGPSSQPQQSSYQSSSSSSYVPGIEAGHDQSYQADSSWNWMRQDSGPTNGAQNNSSSQVTAPPPPPPPISAWSADGNPPAATAWPAPRPNPWDSQQNQQQPWQQQQQHQQEEPVPEWQIQPEEEEPPDEPYLPSTNGAPGAAGGSEELYTENLALARLRKEEETGGGGGGAAKGTAGNVLIGLTSSSSGAAQGSSHVSKPVTDQAGGGGDDMEMCGDEDADFDSFAHEQLEQQVHSGVPLKFTQPPPSEQMDPQFSQPPPREQQNFNEPPPREQQNFNGPPPHEQQNFNGPPPHEQQNFNEPPPNEQLEFIQPPPGSAPNAGPGNGERGSGGGGGGSGSGPRGISNKPTYGYVLPEKSHQDTEKEEKEHQKTLSLQERLRSLAGVAQGEQQHPKPPAFQQPPLPPGAPGPPGAAPPNHMFNEPPQFHNNRGRGGGGPPPRGFGGNRGGPPFRGGGSGPMGGGGPMGNGPPMGGGMPMGGGGGGGGPSPRGGRGGPRPMMDMRGGGGQGPRGGPRGGGGPPRGGGNPHHARGGGPPGGPMGGSRGGGPPRGGGGPPRGGMGPRGNWGPPRGGGGPPRGRGGRGQW